MGDFSFNWIGKLSELQQKGQPFVLATVVKCTGSTPRAIGAKMMVEADRSFHGTIGGGKLESLVIDEALKLLNDDSVSANKVYPLCLQAGQCCGGSVQVMFEVINSGPQLYLFGAGHVGQALCNTLANTPFQVHLIDERREWLEHQNLSPEIRRHETAPQKFISDSAWDQRRTYVSIMTHSHFLDEEIVEQVVTKPTRFIGLIGSRTKWQRFHQRLTKKGVDESLLQAVKCPIGSPLGKAPKEVAISIAAELLRTHYGNQTT